MTETRQGTIRVDMLPSLEAATEAVLGGNHAPLMQIIYEHAPRGDVARTRFYKQPADCLNGIMESTIKMTVKRLNDTGRLS